MAERRNVVREKYTGRGVSSRLFVRKFGEITFFCGRCNTGGIYIYSNSTAVVVTATLLKGRNFWNFLVQHRQVYIPISEVVSIHLLRCCPFWTVLPSLNFNLLIIRDHSLQNISYIRPPAPHTFRSSLDRTSKSKIWPIFQWGGEANYNP